MVFVEPRILPADQLWFRSAHAAHKARRDLIAGGETRCHHRKLQGRAKYEALTDRGVDRVTDHPTRAAFALLPTIASGINPSVTADMPILNAVPMPNLRAVSEIRSMPTLRARS